MNVGEPRLPIYLLLDCSSSMAGEPLEATKQGVKVLLSELCADQQAVEDAVVSVIAFDTVARQVLPLTTLDQVMIPALYAGGISALGSALKLLESCMAQDLQKNDWQPVVFLFSDGIRQDLPQAYVRSRHYRMIGCAAGAGADQSALLRETDQLILLNTLSVGDFIQYCLCLPQ